MSLAGKTILITGAAGGLGQALALRCAANGANLLLLDKNRRGLGELSDRIVEQGYAPPGLYPMNLAGAGVEDFLDLVDIIKSEYGDLHALVHCALDFDGLQLLEQVEPQRWLESLQVNVNAPWMLSCACLPLLKASESSRLFFMLDDLERVTGAYWGAYGVSKAALTGLVKQFAEALGNTPVQTRGINPGPMRTGFRTNAYHAENPLEQPEPGVAAAKIADMLSGDLAGIDRIVNLEE